jgi:hypothetical protein
MIRVQYVTIESDSAEVIATALRALSVQGVSIAPQFGELLTTERPEPKRRAIERTPRAPAPSAAPPAEATSARAPRVSQGDAASVIKGAFAKDSSYPLTKLAAEIYGAADGRGVQKVKITIAGLVGRGELERLGATSWRVTRAKPARVGDVETLEPDDSDDADDDSEK